MSDVTVSNECVEALNKFKLEQYRGVISEVTGKEIVVRHTCTGTDGADYRADYEAFAKELAEYMACQYAVYNFAYEMKGQRHNKVLFISWLPDGASIKSQTLHAESQRAFMQHLDRGSLSIRASEPSDIGYDTVLEKVTQLSG